MHSHFFSDNRVSIQPIFLLYSKLKQCYLTQAFFHNCSFVIYPFLQRTGIGTQIRRSGVSLSLSASHIVQDDSQALGLPQIANRTTSLPPNLALGSIEWLHIPKTGTSFGNILVSTFCNLPTDTLWIKREGAKIPPECLKIFRNEGSKVRSNWPIGDHVSLQGRSVSELQKVFTMIRSPGTRLLSGFHHKTLYRRLNSTEEEVCHYISQSNIAHSSKSAQVKMVVGKVMSSARRADQRPLFKFRDPGEASEEDTQLACMNLEIMAFVGISDYWEASVCLFHSQYGGEMSDADVVNVRKGRYDKKEMTTVDCNDEMDEYLFQCAMRLLLSRLRLHRECGAFVEYKDFGLPAVDSMLQVFLKEREKDATRL